MKNMTERMKRKVERQKDKKTDKQRFTERQRDRRKLCIPQRQTEIQTNRKKDRNNSAGILKCILIVTELSKP